MRPHSSAANAKSSLLVVCGPTASGKSALALAAAEALGGTVINADALQVYRELSILTARPGPAELARVPHRLYGVLGVAEACSVARWRALALDEIASARAVGRLPILVGGSGLYLKALLDGLSDVPDIPPEVRAGARGLLDELGPAGLHARLALRDPEGAARLRPGDRARILRAWEVLEATGRPLAAWHAMPAPRPDGAIGRAVVVRISPPREALYAACDGRFRAMIAAGGLDEARHVAALGLPDDRPALKALGLRELIDHVRGASSLEQAIVGAQLATRHYAKRQVTWFRHQIRIDLGLDAQYSERAGAEIMPKICDRLLTAPD
jgi:tRNA dimethylallyltransferase